MYFSSSSLGVLPGRRRIRAVFKQRGHSGLRVGFTTDRDGDDEIYVMDADGTAPVRLTSNPGMDVIDSWRRSGMAESGGLRYFPR